MRTRKKSTPSELPVRQEENQDKSVAGSQGNIAFKERKISYAKLHSPVEQY